MQPGNKSLFFVKIIIIEQGLRVAKTFYHYFIQLLARGIENFEPVKQLVLCPRIFQPPFPVLFFYNSI